MRNLSILLFTLMLLFSCSNDDDNTSNSFINPPSWIHGTWLDESEPEWSQDGGFQFTNDNLLLVNTDGQVDINLKEGLQDGVNTGSITTEEIISDTEYNLAIISNGSTNVSYSFKKDTETTIIYELSSIYNVTLTKQ